MSALQQNRALDRASRTVTALLDQIDAQRTAIVREIATLSPAAQQWRAGPTIWSAVEVLEHLVLAEQEVLGDLATAAARAAQIPTGRDRVRAGLVWLILRLGVRVRVPAVTMRPTGQRSLEELQRLWAVQHHALRALATGLDGDGLRRRVFRHPIAGPSHMIDALRLLTAHLGTHQRQLQRLLTASRAHCPG